MLVVTVPIAGFLMIDVVNGSGKLDAAIWVAILPLAVAAPLVIGASIVFGLPIMLWLRRTGRESHDAYIVAGGGIGFFLPIVALGIVGAPSGYWVGFLGLLSGAMTARTWWHATRPNRPG